MSHRALTALDKFLSDNIEVLKHCFKQQLPQNASSSSKYSGQDATRINHDSDRLSQVLRISQETAQRIVLRFKDHSNLKPNNRLAIYARFYCGEERYKIKLVSEILRLRVHTPGNQQRKDLLIPMVRKHSTELLIDTEFFVDIITTIKQSFLLNMNEPDHDVLGSLRKSEVCVHLITSIEK